MLSRRSFVGTLASLFLFPLLAFTNQRRKIYIPPNGPGTHRDKILWIGQIRRANDGMQIYFWGFDGAGTVPPTKDQIAPGLQGWSFDELEYLCKNKERILQDHGILHYPIRSYIPAYKPAFRGFNRAS